MGRALVFTWWLLFVVLLTPDVKAEQPVSPTRNGESVERSKSAVEQAMGGLSWGMSHEELTALVANMLRKQEAERLAEAESAADRVAIRMKIKEATQRFRDSRLDFDGHRTSWDASFARHEFTHGNGESMMFRRDDNSLNLYFFIDGKLWKWFKAFDVERLSRNDYAWFTAELRKKFFRGVQGTGAMPGTLDRAWHTGETYAHTEDHGEFDGYYGLVFESRRVRERLGELRTAHPKADQALQELIDRYTLPDPAAISPSLSADSAGNGEG